MKLRKSWLTNNNFDGIIKHFNTIFTATIFLFLIKKKLGDRARDYETRMALVTL